MDGSEVRADHGIASLRRARGIEHIATALATALEKQSAGCVVSATIASTLRSMMFGDNVPTALSPHAAGGMCSLHQAVALRCVECSDEVLHAMARAAVATPPPVSERRITHVFNESLNKKYSTR